MLGNKLLRAALCRQRGSAFYACPEDAPVSAVPPSVIESHSLATHFQSVLHVPAHVVLAVKPAGGFGDCQPRHDLCDEHDTPADFPLHLTPHIETQVDFREIGVKRNRQLSAQSGFEKPEADQAHVGFALKGIQFSSTRHMAAEELRLYLVIKQE